MKKYAIGCIAVLLASCRFGLFDNVNQVVEDPFNRAPIIHALAEENAITIEWDADPGAEEYILNRAVDAEGPQDFEEIYRGDALKYIDKGIKNGSRYLYALGKQRGSAYFKPQHEVLGVASDFSRDDYEPNDGKGQATLIRRRIEANIFYYTGYHDRTVSDTDWYFITIPPGFQAEIWVQQLGITTENTYMDLYKVVSTSPEAIKNNQGTVIAKNLSSTEEVVYFRIAPNTQKFLDDRNFYSRADEPGGGMVAYTIDLKMSTF